MNDIRYESGIPDEVGMIMQTPSEMSESLERAEMYHQSIASQLNAEEQYSVRSMDSLTQHILNSFRKARDARRISGVDDELMDSLQAFNSEYTAAQKRAISVNGGGSKIFMPLTATKSRVVASWVRDIILNPITKSWRLTPTKVPELPQKLTNAISSSIDKEFEKLAKEKLAAKEAGKKPEQPQQGQSPDSQSQQGQQVQLAPEVNSPKADVSSVQETVRELNREKREILRAVKDEIYAEAKFSMEFMEDQIEDQLQSGGYYDAMSDLIDDFGIFPTCFLKGPILTKEKKITWENGKPVVRDSYFFRDKRVSPFDMYPAPGASTIYEGDLCEHVRYEKPEVYKLIGRKNYQEGPLRAALDSRSGRPSWLDTGMDEERAQQERKGDSFTRDEGFIHGIHFFGSVEGKMLLDWGIADTQIVLGDPQAYYEVEALLLENEVVKCVLNKDPLLRRPYYSACFLSRPGSVWGSSLPWLLKGVQAMCNKTARDLANNIAMSSGVQIGLNIDLLADDGDITDIHPFKIWQFTNSPLGAAGKPIEFFQAKINAQELLGVYDKFEQKADDISGVPKFAYGNMDVRNVPQTASGLAMLFESSSKLIKDGIRCIDRGVIVPRIKYQFYWNIITNKVDFTGDVDVTAIGSSVLSVKGAEQMKRNEFLSITANAIDQSIMGTEGRSNLIQQVSEDIGVSGDIVPKFLDRRLKEKEDAERQGIAQKNQMALEEHKAKLRTLGAETQIEGQKEMHDKTTEIKVLTEEGKMVRHAETIQAKREEIKAFNDQQAQRSMQTAASKVADNEAKAVLQSKELAVKLTTGQGI